MATSSIQEYKGPELIIGICGLKRSGKSTIANILANVINAKEITVAGPLKEICGILFGFSKEQMETDDKEKKCDNYDFTPRLALQRIGTDCFRERMSEFFPEYKPETSNIWTNILYNKLKKMSGIVVVSDIRFPDEIDVIRKFKNYVLIEVVRPSISIDKKSEHKAETQDLKINKDNERYYRIINDSSVEELRKKILNLPFISESNKK